MATISEVVAAVVVHSSAFAFSHFGVTLDTPQLDQRQPAAAERVVARTPRKPVQKLSTKIAADCPETQRLRAVRA